MRFSRGDCIGAACWTMRSEREMAGEMDELFKCEWVSLADAPGVAHLL